MGTKIGRKRAEELKNGFADQTAETLATHSAALKSSQDQLTQEIGRREKCEKDLATYQVAASMFDVALPEMRMELDVVKADRNRERNRVAQLDKEKTEARRAVLASDKALKVLRMRAVVEKDVSDELQKGIREIGEFVDKFLAGESVGV